MLFSVTWKVVVFQRCNFSIFRLKCTLRIDECILFVFKLFQFSSKISLHLTRKRRGCRFSHVGLTAADHADLVLSCSKKSLIIPRTGFTHRIRALSNLDNLL